MVGPSRCVGAFSIALNQAGSSGWFSSTLQLQLASLQFCVLCRSVSTLHLIVEDGMHTLLLEDAPASGVKVKGAAPYACSDHSAPHIDVEASGVLFYAILKRGLRECSAAYVRVPLQRRSQQCCMAIVAPPTHVRKRFQPSGRRDCVAGVTSAAHVWGLVQPGDRRGRVAGVASAARVRILFQPGDRQGRVICVASAARVRE